MTAQHERRVRKITPLEIGGTTRNEKHQCDEPSMPGSIPRVTRLMALAIRFEELLRSGKARDLNHLAAVSNVSQPRISQILSVTMLAPDIQELLPFLPWLTKKSGNQTIALLTVVHKMRKFGALTTPQDSILREEFSMSSLLSAFAINTNPMVFEELATSLATLASYARNDLDQPVRDLEHLFGRALQVPPSYDELTSLTGHSLTTIDRNRGRGAWLLSYVEGLDIYSVHSRVWHKVGAAYSAPLVSQMSRALGVNSSLNAQLMQDEGSEMELLDIAAVKDECIWLVQVISSDKVIDSAYHRLGTGNQKLARSVVFGNPIMDEKSSQSLACAKRLMEIAFPGIDVVTAALVLHPTCCDFELYQVELPSVVEGGIPLTSDMIRKNSIDFADVLAKNRDALFELPHPVENDLFRGIPPCRGGRTLGMLASAASRQRKSSKLLSWQRKDFIEMLIDDFEYEVEQDKVRHDLDDRLVAQGFFRKWGPSYFISMKGIARYQYCLAKFTTFGSKAFCLDECVAQRDRIIEKYGCLI
jgi:hypothetical protein